MAPPRDEMPTNLPFKSAMERISFNATMSNCGLADAVNTSLTGMPRTAAAMVEPDAEVKSTEPPSNACMPTAPRMKITSTSSPSSR